MTSATTRDFDAATGVWRSISAFNLIILTMIVALALFHYWRVQDGVGQARGGQAW